MAGPGADIKLSVQWRTEWKYNSGDYCPGCVVQLYYGMGNIFRRGVVQHGLRTGQDGTDVVAFKGPAVPGLYYVRQEISLQYNYVDGQSSNKPLDAIAVIRVRATPAKTSEHASLCLADKSNPFMRFEFKCHRSDPTIVP